MEGKPNDKECCRLSDTKNEREPRRNILSAAIIYNLLKRLTVELWMLCSTGFWNSLFLSVLDQHMVAKIELEAFNQIGQGNFAATVTENQLIELCIDVCSI